LVRLSDDQIVAKWFAGETVRQCVANNSSDDELDRQVTTAGCSVTLLPALDGHPIFRGINWLTSTVVGMAEDAENWLRENHLQLRGYVRDELPTTLAHLRQSQRGDIAASPQVIPANATPSEELDLSA